MSRSHEPPRDDHDRRDRGDRARAHPRVRTNTATAANGAKVGARAGGKERDPEAGAHIERGARVRVLQGPFLGKVGTVQELDGKGGARVMLGLLAVRVETRDLAPDGAVRDRPRLSSSHRKRMPARS
jgi:transcription antitermination factor NusG